MTYESPPEQIEQAKEVMRIVKASLTKDANGSFPTKTGEMEWDWMYVPPPKTAWQEMDANTRFNTLCDCMEEGIWLDRDDSQKLAEEFVRAEERGHSYDQMLTEAASQGGNIDKDKSHSR